MQNSPFLWVAKNTARFISLVEGVLAPAKLTNSIFEILFHKDTSSSMEFFNFSLVLPMEKRSWDGRKEQILRNNSGGRLSIVKSTSRKYGYNFSENFSTSFPLWYSRSTKERNTKWSWTIYFYLVNIANVKRKHFLLGPSLQDFSFWAKKVTLSSLKILSLNALI